MKLFNIEVVERKKRENKFRIRLGGSMKRITVIRVHIYKYIYIYVHIYDSDRSKITFETRI